MFGPVFRSLDSGAETGESLPVVWKTLANAGISLMRGDVTMIAGPPGCGKSMLALQHAIKSEVPTFYLMMDMGRYLTAVRVAAMISGEPISKLQEKMSFPQEREKYRGLIASKCGNLYIAYASRPTPDQVKELELAFEEVWGIPPVAFYVDNMMNLYSGSENEWTGLRELSHVFHYFAQDLGSAVIELHHVNLGGYNIGNPAPLSAIKGQITELPALILTIAKGEGQMKICPVKNRHGQSDYSGAKYVSLLFKEECGRIEDLLPAQSTHLVRPTNVGFVDRMALQTQGA